MQKIEPAALEADEEGEKLENAEGAKLAEAKPVPFEPPPLKKGIIALWRARCITPYNPDLLPPEPVPLQEEVRISSVASTFSVNDIWYRRKRYIKYIK